MTYMTGFRKTFFNKYLSQKNMILSWSMKYSHRVVVHNKYDLENQSSILLHQD